MEAFRPSSLTEKFSFFCEVIGPLGFMHRLLRHGLSFGSMMSVKPKLELSQLITGRMRSNLACYCAMGRGRVGQLGLQITQSSDETMEVAGDGPGPYHTTP